MGSAGDLGTDEGIFRMENMGVYGLKSISPQVIIAVPGRSKQTGLAYFGILHGFDNFQLVIFGSIVDLRKSFFESFQDAFPIRQYFFGYSKRLVYIMIA